VPTSYINFESQPKSSMKQASGSPSLWKLGWSRPSLSRTSSRKIVSLPASSGHRSGPSKPKSRESANNQSPIANNQSSITNHQCLPLILDTKLRILNRCLTHHFILIPSEIESHLHGHSCMVASSICCMISESERIPCWAPK
jgi:hypothetical protein